MFDFSAYLWGLMAIQVVVIAGWAVSYRQHNVNIVDSLWSLLFVIAAIAYALTVPEPGSRTGLVILLVLVWGLRLAVHLGRRNWGKPEDHRYQEMRDNDPHFATSSLYKVFILQGVIAWVVSLPLLAAIAATQPMGILDYLGVLLWLVGFFFESEGDRQLARFKADPSNKGQVLDSGLWRYTRHPNYFGDFCVWWGFYLIALAAGGWWSIIGPIVMSVFLMKVSGVALTEKTIVERRPGYREYIQRTNAFFPGPPRGQ